MQEDTIPSDKARFAITQRGKPLTIDHLWHQYTKDNEKGQRTFWRCAFKYAKKCPARAATISSKDNKVVYLSDNHNHGSEIVRTKVKLMEQEAVQKAVENPSVPPRRVLGELSMRYQTTSELAAKASNENLARRINYKRKKENEAPGEPSDWHDIEEPPEKFTKTASDGRFLLLNTISENRPGVLLFSSDWQLNLLSDADSITADGTFKTAPDPFRQVYTIVANFHKNRRNYPVAFALLPDKTANVYSQIWSTMSQYLLEPPRAVRVDFETADLKAIQQVFPDATIEGCFFHFRSALWRNIQDKKLVPIYNAHTSFQIYVKSLISLAYVPVDRVCHYFELLQESKPEERVPEVDDFEHYFEATYIGLKWGTRGTRKVSRFPIPIWNQYQRALAKTDKTTNSAESWNSAWSKAASCSDGLWKVIESLRREEALTQSKFMDHLQRDSRDGKNPQNARQARRSDFDERMANLCHRIDDLDPVDYLHTLAQLFDLE
jgi:hypothetical protein